MSGMTLTLHGTGAGTPSGHRMASAVSARFGSGDVVLFDAGEGCARAMIRDGVDINRVRTVAISHMHADHWCGLPGLVTGWGTLDRGRDAIGILVPAGRIPFFERALLESLLFAEQLPFTINWSELAPFEVGAGWSAEPFATTHLAKIEELADRHDVSGSAVGYLLRNGDRRIVLSQDIGGVGDLTGIIDGAELVVCESAHVEAAELLALARDARVGRVVFTHVAPRREGSFPDRFDGIEWKVADDGLRIEIE